jgi:hypothetical protein
MTESYIYRIFDRNTGEQKGAYSRSYHTEYDFSSVSDARNSNVNDIYRDRVKYRIAKYKVTVELVEEDADPAKPDEVEFSEHIKKIESEPYENDDYIFDGENFHFKKEFTPAEKFGLKMGHSARIVLAAQLGYKGIKASDLYGRTE